MAVKKTLVFGASLKSNRYSYAAMTRLALRGIDTVAFGKKEGEVSGIPISTDVRDFSDIHTITLYMNPTAQKKYYDEIIGLGPERVIFNPGTENPEFYPLLKAEGIEVLEACTLVLLATGQY